MSLLEANIKVNKQKETFSETQFFLLFLLFLFYRCNLAFCVVFSVPNSVTEVFDFGIADVSSELHICDSW